MPAVQRRSVLWHNEAAADTAQQHASTRADWLFSVGPSASDWSNITWHACFLACSCVSAACLELAC
jgi:hypothetical protein